MNKYLIVGCGEKQIKRFKEECVALDINLKSLIKSKKLRPHHFYIQADANFLPFKENLFNQVICTEVLEHIKTPKKALLEINKVLVNEGKAILSVPFADACKNLAEIFPAYRRDFFESYHISGFTKKSFLDLLKKTNFKINKIKRLGRTEFYFWRLWAYLSRIFDLDVYIEETGRLKLNTQNKLKSTFFNLVSKGIRLISIPLGKLFPVYTGIKVKIRK